MNIIRLRSISLFFLALLLLLTTIQPSNIFAVAVDGQISKVTDTQITSSSGSNIVHANQGESLFFSTKFTLTAPSGGQLKAGDTFRIELPKNTNPYGITSTNEISARDILPDFYRGGYELIATTEYKEDPVTGDRYVLATLTAEAEKYVEINMGITIPLFIDRDVVVDPGSQTLSYKIGSFSGSDTFTINYNPVTKTTNGLSCPIGTNPNQSLVTMTDYSATPYNLYRRIIYLDTTSNGSPMDFNDAWLVLQAYNNTDVSKPSGEVSYSTKAPTIQIYKTDVQNPSYGIATTLTSGTKLVEGVDYELTTNIPSKYNEVGVNPYGIHFLKPLNGKFTVIVDGYFLKFEDYQAANPIVNQKNADIKLRSKLYYGDFNTSDNCTALSLNTVLYSHGASYADGSFPVRKIWEDNSRNDISATKVGTKIKLYVVKAKTLAEAQQLTYADALTDSYSQKIEVDLDGIPGSYTETTPWEHTFQNLPPLGQDEHYYIREQIYNTTTRQYVEANPAPILVENPNGIGYFVVNREQGLEIPVEKRWIDSNYQPVVPAAQTTVEIQLLADGQPALDSDGVAVPNLILDGTTDTTETTAWKAAFKNLPKSKTAADGTITNIVYTVKEASVKINGTESKDYLPIITQPSTNNLSAIVRNMTLIDVPVSKVWNGVPTTEQGPVEVQLMAKIVGSQDPWKPATDVVFQNVSAQEKTDLLNTIFAGAYDNKMINAPDWKSIFTNVSPIVINDPNSRKVEYSVQEISINGTAIDTLPTINVNVTQDANGVVVTNAYDLEIPVQKIWQGTPSGPVTINLLANGQPAVHTDTTAVAPLVLNGSETTPWSGVFTNLPKVDGVGNKIVYTISETFVDAAKYSSVYEQPTDTNMSARVINKELTSISIRKVWTLADGTVVSANQAPMPKTVENNQLVDYTKDVYYLVQYKTSNTADYAPLPIALTNKTASTDSQYVIVKDVPGSSVTVDNLIKNDAKNQPVQFEFVEWAGPTYADGPWNGYTYESTLAPEQGVGETSFVLTNRNIEAISIPVKKVWVGQLGKTTTIDLTNNDTVLDSIVLDGVVDSTDPEDVTQSVEITPWGGWFKDLPVYEVDANGNVVPINYDGLGYRERGAVDYSVNKDRYNNDSPVHLISIEGRDGVTRDYLAHYDVDDAGIFFVSNVETTEVSATKIWKRDGVTSTKPAAVADVFVKLQQTINGKTSDVLDASGQPIIKPIAQATFTKLPIVDNQNNLITYRMVEMMADPNNAGSYLPWQSDGYTSSNEIDSAKPSQTNFINDYTVPRISFTATKQWVDGPLTDHTATAVTFNLYRKVSGGVEELVTGVTPVVSGTNPTFTYTWENLPQVNEENIEYIYSVKEANVSADNTIDINGNVYVVSQSGNTITNTYQTQLTQVVATKNWVNGPQSDHVADSIVLELYRNGQKLNNVPTVSGAAPQFKYTWTNLPKTDASGNAYTYTVQEANVTGGQTTVNGNKYTVSQTDLTITNTYGAPVKDIVATKTWVNGPVADHVQVNLQLSRQAGTQPVEVVSANPTVVKLSTSQYQYTWSNLATKNESGVDYVYTVKELNTTNGYVIQNGNMYAVAEKGLTVTNTYQQPTDGIFEAEKIWVNGPTSDHKPVELILKQNGVDYASTPVVTPTATGFKYQWSNLPSKDESGNPYLYTVLEKGTITENGRTIVMVGTNKYVVSQSGNTITNTFEALPTKVVATKTWVNGPTSDHQAVDFQLVRSINGSLPEVVNDAVVVKSGQAPTFTYTWGNLPKTNELGVPYVYSVQESKVENGIYTSQSGLKYQVSQKGFDITNTYQPEGQVVIPVTKVYKGTNGGAVTLDLMNGNTRVDSVILDGVIDAIETKPWSATFKPLPKINNQGLIIDYSQYSVVERGAINGKIELAGLEYNVNVTGDINGFVVTNTQQLKPETTTFLVEKVWKGIDLSKAPEVTVYLTQNGQLTDQKVILNQANHWKATFDNLIKLDSSNQIIQYGVKEMGEDQGVIKIDDVTYRVSYLNGRVLNEKVLPVSTKPIPETIQYMVKKVWEGIDASKAPAVTIYLTRNGQITNDKVTLSQANNWKTSFNNLLKYDQLRRPIEYGVKESGEVKGVIKLMNDRFKVTYSQGTITNKKINELPKTGDSLKWIRVIAGFMVCVGLGFMVIARKKKEN